MKLHEEVNVNKAVLPRLLPRFLFKLHLFKLSLGIVITILGILAMCLFSVLGFVTLLAAGITSMCAGVFGSLANRLKFLVLHGGSVFVYGLSFCISLIAYAAAYAGVGAVYEFEGNVVAFMVCMQLLLMVDLITSALNLGVELIVIYVADCQRRLAIEDMRREASLS